MDGFNRIVSFVLGLVVVIVVIAVVSGKLRLGQKTATKVSPTVTKNMAPTKQPSYMPQPTSTMKEVVKAPTTTMTSPATTIPKTGAETVMLPLSMVGLLAGYFLKRKS